MAHEKHLARTIDGALIHLLDKDNTIKISPSAYFKKYVRVLLPYAITPFSNTGRMFLVNREYKPLGIGDFNEWVDYTEYQCSLSQQSYEQLSELPLVDGLKNAAGIFLYQDSTCPWDAQAHMDSYHQTLKQLVTILKSNIICG
ncbi:hypothetical protein HR45_05110 [Shewanella mangrovi]|uniref:Uncharacterized protein n=1 Tax=Shewanella mangrovi TaxID=1515746 RepID=A0A094JHW8_9GAMM|nr:hypothetical protein [Shewanella mangrovi]KFZ38792.1 hypothetical protein HR45_05110 [Shewanella mangrovi]